MLASQNISSPTKKPTTITVIHFNITSCQSSHVDTTLPSLVVPSTKTQRRSASLKPASRVPRFRFKPRHGPTTPATPHTQNHPPTWPQEAGSKHWPWHPHKNPAIWTCSSKQSSDFGNPKKNICGKDFKFNLSVVLKEGLF